MDRNSNHIWLHLVWCVKYRKSIFSDDTMIELTTFIDNHFKDRTFEIVCSNGYRDHLHVLVKPGLLDSPGKITKDIKGASSFWINKNGKIKGRFAWQRGYAAYSVSPHNVGKIIRYISNQQSHHGSNPG